MQLVDAANDVAACCCLRLDADTGACVAAVIAAIKFSV